MDRLATASAKERSNVFSEAAAKRGIRSTIIEKDFWVCYVLKVLFAESPFNKHLVFKGGTSLSKVCGLLDRFSEDIDLVLDWKLIGFGEGINDPLRKFESKSQQDKFNKKVNQIAASYIAETLCPRLDGILQEKRVGLSAGIDEKDAQTVNIRYSDAFRETYIRPEVRLEIGPLASWVPSAWDTIQPYAFEVFPDVFDSPGCPVLAITAERTFWEKATILHREAHRAGLIPPRHSRHYYDLYKLTQRPVKEAAFLSLQQLRDVVAFKTRFYPSTWARYDLATPGSFKLLPSPKEQISNLKRDYRDMQVMLFGEAPAFESILDALRQLEEQINSLD